MLQQWQQRALTPVVLVVPMKCIWVRMDYMHMRMQVCMISGGKPHYTPLQSASV